MCRWLRKNIKKSRLINYTIYIERISIVSLSSLIDSWVSNVDFVFHFSADMIDRITRKWNKIGSHLYIWEIYLHRKHRGMCKRFNKIENFKKEKKQKSLSLKKECFVYRDDRFFSANHVLSTTHFEYQKSPYFISMMSKLHIILNFRWETKTMCWSIDFLRFIIICLVIFFS